MISAPKPSKHKDYFEGEIQVRNATDEQLDLIRRLIWKENETISKEIVEKNGVDLYVTSQKTIQKIARTIAAKTGAHIKLSRHLFSRNRHTGKQVYRLNLLVDIPDYSKGDCLTINGKLFLVTSLGKKLSCVGLDTGKKTTITLNKGDYSIIKPVKTMVTKTQPSLEIMDPNTYDTQPCSNPLNLKVANGQKVKVVKYVKFYLIKN